MNIGKKLIYAGLLLSSGANASYPPLGETADALQGWNYGRSYVPGPSIPGGLGVIEGALLKAIPSTAGYSYRFVVQGQPTVFRPTSYAELKNIASNALTPGGDYYVLDLIDFPFHELGGSNAYVDPSTELHLQLKAPDGSIVNLDGDSTDDAQDYKQWDNGQAYSKGIVVAHQGSVYQSIYWTNKEPNEHDRAGSLTGWKLVGGDALKKTPKWFIDIAYPKDSCVSNDGFKFIAKWYVAAGAQPPSITSDGQGWSKASDVDCPYPAD
ncbi:hypothetical protein [Aeromonas veronii]